MPRSSTSLEQNASRWVLWQPTRARVTTPRVAHLISGEPTTARGEPRAAPHSCGHQRGSTSAPRDRHGAWPARESQSGAALVVVGRAAASQSKQGFTVAGSTDSLVRFPLVDNGISARRCVPECTGVQMSCTAVRHTSVATRAAA
jgi:hypothetical protein